MNLTDEQKRKVSEWIESGAKLSDIQDRLGTDFKVSLTYMETRMLVDDLKLTPKDAPEEVAVAVATMPEEPLDNAIPEPEGEAGGGLKLTVDVLARPGTVVSGGVTFSDGKRATWYLDQTGRMGVSPEEEGYRPSPADVQSFQVALEQELAKRGF